MTTTDRFVFFYGGPFSQWAPATFDAFLPDGATASRFSSAEQYMMASKALLFGDSEALESILKSDDPRLVKELGRGVRNFDKAVWESKAKSIVYAGNVAKFGQNPSLLEVLLNTGRRSIVEASPTDRIWGIGRAESDPRIHDVAQWDGTNWLGEVLMDVRHHFGGSPNPVRP